MSAQGTEALGWAEQALVAGLGWPSWAVRVIGGLLVLVLVTAVLEQFYGPATVAPSTSAKAKCSSFRWFQVQYLSVYLITMLADWLQGTNMYTLYTSYGVDVGTLFLTGFLSSAVFGTFLGVFVDSWGRKAGIVLFCLLEIVINLLEHVPSMPALLAGRVLGGLSTSLLFTAFESWMVSEHRRRGFDEELLASTFSLASAGNGIAAISAGVCAQLTADANGDIGPFQLAIALTVVTLALVLPWAENYGGEHEVGGGAVRQLVRSLRLSLQVLRAQPTVCVLGLSQAFFEGAVYSFVFLWVPSLMQASGGTVPTGLVFSAFMLAMTWGGMLSGLLLRWLPGGPEAVMCLIFLFSAAAMAVPVYSFSFPAVLGAFLLLETMVGMFNSCGATLRSRYYPQDLQASIMSVFRLPLNLLVVAGTRLANNAAGPADMRFVFGVLALLHWVALVLQLVLCVMPPAEPEPAAGTIGKDQDGAGAEMDRQKEKKRQ